MTPQNPVETDNRLPRVYFYSLSFLTNRAQVKLLTALGWKPRFGVPRLGDVVGVWGRRPTARRGQRIAALRGVETITFEDGFLRSVETGRQRALSHSLIADRQGIYFETGQPNDLADLLAGSALKSAAELENARIGLAALRQSKLSKYNNFGADMSDLPPKFVLIIDQTLHDASIAGGQVHAGTFQQMLDAAKRENPDVPIVIKAHPETNAAKRRGYFDRGDGADGVQIYTGDASPWEILERAVAVYTVTSQMGLEAIFAGHRPVVFGKAFYSGYGLSDDRHPDVQLRGTLSAEQIFDAAYLSYCRWYDPALQRETDIYGVMRGLSAAQRLQLAPSVFSGMRLWKRGFLKRFFDARHAARFEDDPVRAATIAARSKAAVGVWAGKETEELASACAAQNVPLWRVEDGFIRSSGLGAELREPVSLALDDVGIYYDATRPSRLENLIQRSRDLSRLDLQRAAELRKTVVSLGISKYNLAGQAPDFARKTGQKLVLVPGQVEDDQSILKGAVNLRTNLDLMRKSREMFPNDVLIYKPHPDVLAGLREGGATLADIEGLADHVALNSNITELLEQVDVVCTLTSLTGFEALLRDCQVVCFGLPFYAGWGLTTDHAPAPNRRQDGITLDGLVHAALIDYPMYWDPVTGHPCPPETVLERFSQGQFGKGRPAIRALAKIQGLFASYAHLWR